MTSTLDFLITAKDEASKVFNEIGDSVEKSKGKFDKFQAGANIAMAAVAAGAVEFAKKSVEAYSEHEDAQTKLAYAFQQFPALGLEPEGIGLGSSRRRRYPHCGDRAGLADGVALGVVLLQGVANGAVAQIDEAAAQSFHHILSPHRTACRQDAGGTGNQFAPARKGGQGREAGGEIRPARFTG